MTRITRYALPLALLAILFFGTGQTALAHGHHHHHHGAWGGYGGYGFGGYRGFGYPYGYGYRGFGGYPGFGYGVGGWGTAYSGFGYNYFPNYSFGYVPAFGAGAFSNPNYGAWGGFNVW